MEEKSTAKLSKKENLMQTIKFTLFSASAGVIQFLTFTALNELPPKLFHTELSYWVCYLPALILSVIYNFTLNRKFTFKSANNVPIAMLKVAGYYAVFTPLSTWLGNMAVDSFTPTDKQAFMYKALPYIVEVVTMLANFITEFLFDRFVVFRASINTNDIAKKDAAKAETLEED
jgi:putative flippase GtrA